MTAPTTRRPTTAALAREMADLEKRGEALLEAARILTPFGTAPGSRAYALVLEGGAALIRADEIARQLARITIERERARPEVVPLRLAHSSRGDAA